MGKKIKKPLEMRKCAVCGKEFMQIRGNQLVCGDACRKKRDKEVQAQWREKNLFYKRKNAVEESQEIEKPKKEKTEKEKPERTEPKSNYEEIVDIAIEARKHGMSYGQYVAMMHMKGEQK